MTTKMANPRDITNSVANTTRRKFVDTVQRFNSKNIAAQKLQSAVNRQIPSFQI